MTAQLVEGECVAITGKVRHLDDDEVRYCEFCNSVGAVAERGLVRADVELRFGYAADDDPADPFRATIVSCEMCLDGAPRGSWSELHARLSE